MSKIQASSNIAQVKPEDVPRFVDLFCQEVIRVINGGLDFSTNFNANIVAATFSVANTDLAVSHSLGRIPSGFMTISPSAAMMIYAGATDNTTSTLYLRSSAAGAAGILVF